MKEALFSVSLLIFLAMGFSMLLGHNELTLVIATIMADIVRVVYLHAHNKTLLQEFQEFKEKNRYPTVDKFLKLQESKQEEDLLDKIFALFKK